MLGQRISDEECQHIYEYDRNNRECSRIPERVAESGISKCFDIILESYPLRISRCIESAETQIDTLKERPDKADDKAYECREYEQRKTPLYRSANQNTVHGRVIVFLFLFTQIAHPLSLFIALCLYAFVKKQGQASNARPCFLLAIS